MGGGKRKLLCVHKCVCTHISACLHYLHQGSFIHAYACVCAYLHMYYDVEYVVFVCTNAVCVCTCMLVYALKVIELYSWHQLKFCFSIIWMEELQKCWSIVEPCVLQWYTSLAWYQHKFVFYLTIEIYKKELSLKFDTLPQLIPPPPLVLCRLLIRLRSGSGTLTGCRMWEQLRAFVFSFMIQCEQGFLFLRFVFSIKVLMFKKVFIFVMSFPSCKTKSFSLSLVDSWSDDTTITFLYQKHEDNLNCHNLKTAYVK